MVAGASGHATTLRAPLELACQGDLLAVVFLVGLVCLGVAHHLAQVLVVHLSSLFLNLRRADFGARANLCVALAPWPPCGRRVAAVWLPCGCRVAAVWLTCG